MTKSLIELLLVPLHIISIDISKNYLNNVIANLVAGELDEFCVIKEQ